jgi:HAE1 family hydrophobic/amphiphilic exporter-1
MNISTSIRVRRTAGVVLVPLLAAAGGLWGQTPATGRLELTVEQAILMALRNNRDIEVARVDLLSSETAVSAAAGIYDPLFGLSAYKEKRTLPVSSILAGSATGSLHEGETTVTPRVAGLVERLGSSYSVSLYSSRQSTENLFVPFSPQYSTALMFNYSQPLLRGLRIDAGRRALQISRKNLNITESQFRQRVMDTVTQTVQTYWDLAFARAHLEVQTLALADARRLLESNRRLVREGILAPIDLVETGTQVAAIETGVYIARDVLNRTTNAVKLILLAERTAPEWAAEIVPVSTPTQSAPKVSYEEAVKTALEKRPEPQQFKETREINDLNTRYFRDQTKPEINLVASYTRNGLAGVVIDRPGNPLFGSLSVAPAPVFLGGYGTAMGNLLDERFPTVRVGVQVSAPFRNRTAEANLRGAELATRKLRAQTDQVLAAIEFDVRNAIEGLRLAEGRLQAAIETTKLATQQYDSEQRRLQNGVSTVFLVLQRQSGLLSARAREFEAHGNLNKEIAAYYRAVGTTLEENRIDVQSVKR